MRNTCQRVATLWRSRPLPLSACVAQMLLCLTPSGALGLQQPAAKDPPARVASAQPTTTPVYAAGDAGEVDKWIQRLGSEDWRERKAAQDALVNMGESARAILVEIERRAPLPDARAAAHAALARLKGDPFGPTLITLHLKDATPQDVFNGISRQCPVPVPAVRQLWDKGGGMPKLTVDFDRQPFWVVVPQICRSAGLELAPSDDGMFLDAQSGLPRVDGDALVRGAFRIVLTQVSFVRTRFLGASSGERQRIALSIFTSPEPKITALRCQLHLEPLADENGHKLLPISNQPAGASGLPPGTFDGGPGLGWWRFDPEFISPPEGLGGRISKLRGDLTYLVQTAADQLEITDVMNMKPAAKQLGSVQITIKSVKPANGGYDLQSTVAGGLGWQFYLDSLRLRTRLFDNAGNAFPRGAARTWDDRGELAFTVHFEPLHLKDGRAPAPAKLVWEIPTATRQITVPFEFDNVPLFGGRADEPGEPSAKDLEGRIAPDFKLRLLSGDAVSLTQLKGSVVVLDFWATWCGPCKLSLPHLDRIYAEYAPKGLKAYAVNVQEKEDEQDVKDFVTDRELKVPVLLDPDGDAARSFRARAIPETVVIGKDGRVRNVFVGYGRDSVKQLRDAIAQAME